MRERFEVKKFFNNIIVFLLLSSIAFGFVAGFNRFVIGEQFQYHYLASLQDKVHRLKTVNGSRIILVGNSNVAFGINSQKLEEEMGLPVVNLGLHGGLGNAFHEEAAKFNINKGDIVVICHSAFDDIDIIDNPTYAWIIVAHHDELRPLIRTKDYWTVAKAYPYYLKASGYLWLLHRGNEKIDSCYSRESFNLYGDVVYKPKAEQVVIDTFFASKEIEVPKVGDVCVKRLNELNQYVTDRGACMVVAGYPIAYGKYARFKPEDFQKFQTELETALDCPVISDYTDYFFPYEYFFDTHLHLTNEGADIRTEQLISDLKSWLSDKEYPESEKSA